jgi:hypothetical protein
MSKWSERAERAMVTIIRRGQMTLTADDITYIADHPDESHKANARNNAVGPFFNSMRAKGYIKSTNIVHKSISPTRRSGRNLEWTVTSRGLQWAEKYSLPEEPKPVDAPPEAPTVRIIPRLSRRR